MHNVTGAAYTIIRGRFQWMRKKVNDSQTALTNHGENMENEESTKELIEQYVRQIAELVSRMDASQRAAFVQWIDEHM